MEDIWSHPLVVATYAAMFSMVVGGIRALLKLFDRVSDLEKALTEIQNDLNSLSTDLRNHMLEESNNVRHLENSIARLTAALGTDRIGLRE